MSENNKQRVNTYVEQGFFVPTLCSETVPKDYLACMLDKIMGGVILCDYDETTGLSDVLYINRGWSDITGYTQTELTKEHGGNPLALVHPADREKIDILYRQQMSAGNTYELMYRINKKDGEIRWVVDKGVANIQADGKKRNQSIITDITNLKAQEENLRLLAQTDQLTGLNNKATFVLLAEDMLIRQYNICHALVVLDIDGFKNINDSYGHAVGDKALQSLAIQMKTLFRNCDILGRIGGDEFGILITDVLEKKTVGDAADTLRQAVCGIKIPGHSSPVVTVSIGVAFFNGSKTYETLFDEADAALYKAKNKGKNQIVLD